MISVVYMQVILTQVLREVACVGVILIAFPLGQETGGRERRGVHKDSKS